MEGQRRDLGAFIREAEQVGGPAWGQGPEVQRVGAGGGGRIRLFRGAGGAKEDCTLMERHDAAVEECGPGEGPRVGGAESAAG